MKYLILGSSGFIGKHLVRYILSNHHDVIEFDIYNSKLEDLRINNCSNLKSKCLELDFVFFLAFDVGNSEYLSDNDLNYVFINNNVNIMNNTFHILSICQKPFIFVSSQMANYTDTTYGLLKKLGERYTMALGAVFVRLWNVYGDELYSKKSHVITDFIHQAKAFNHIRIKSNGQEERQFLFIEDCINCLFVLSQKYNHINRKEILLVTSFAFTRIITIANILKENIPELKIDTMEKSAWYNRKIMPSRYVFTFWKPEVEINEGIKILLNNYK